MLKQTLKRQTNQAFRTLTQALTNAPDSEFAFPTDDWAASIGGIAMHIASSIDSTFPSDKLFEKWNRPVSCKQECIDYINDCKAQVMIPYIESTDLLDTDSQPEYFISKLDRLLKIIRHIAQHTGTINNRLKAMGLQPGNFI